MGKAVVQHEQPEPLLSAVHRHPTFQFAQGFDQLKEEHDTLRNKLMEFMAIEESIREGKASTDWFGTLRDLRWRVETFLELLSHHADWEGRVLFPIVALYAEKNAAVVEVTEEDHLLAVQYMEAFLQELRKSISPILQSDAIRIMELLMNGYRLLMEHFQAEEQLIFPIAEEIIEDIDYLSS